MLEFLAGVVVGYVVGNTKLAPIVNDGARKVFGAASDQVKKIFKNHY